ncbi:uncharacterized protein [Cicer arietinum]|uniref:Uncharacterized protein LOC101510227 n=1 Tax=Cicer arietinum TaxID=3827 RepID=A0A1S2Z2I4_CICAR|nr:uncharacterized protein LOC101510227 [Cicer arietinum]
MPLRRISGASGSTNGINESWMAQMAQAMAHMAAVIAAQNERELRRDEREERAAESRGLAYFRKHEDIDPEKADKWLQAVDNIFEVIRCPLRVKMKFLDKYFLVSARAKLGDDFLKICQGGMTVGEYAAKFESLSRYFKFFRQTVDEDFMCHRFQDGLKYEIKDFVLPLGIKRFQPLVVKCREIEAMKNRIMNHGNSSNSIGPVRSNNQNRSHGQPEKEPYHRSQEAKGEYRPTIPDSRDKGKAMGTKPYCYLCGDHGHLADKCT